MSFKAADDPDAASLIFFWLDCAAQVPCRNRSMSLTLRRCLEQHTCCRARYTMLVRVSALQRHASDGGARCWTMLDSNNRQFSVILPSAPPEQALLPPAPQKCQGSGALEPWPLPCRQAAGHSKLFKSIRIDKGERPLNVHTITCIHSGHCLSEAQIWRMATPDIISIISSLISY